MTRWYITIHYSFYLIICYNNTDHSLTIQIFQREEARAKGIKKGVFKDFIIQARTRLDGRPLSRKAAEEIRSVAQAQADIEA